MRSTPSLFVVEQRRFGQQRQRIEQRAVDGGQCVRNFAQSRVAGHRLKLLAQFFDHPAQQFGVEDPRRFGKRTERRPAATEPASAPFLAGWLAESPAATTPPG
jgi:glucose-6-phosphate dehydrogenase assembly protein OpcA